jgi:hypothetical protein
LSLWAPVNGQDVLEVRNSLDDKDWCRGEKKERRNIFELQSTKLKVGFSKSGPCVATELGNIKKAVWFRNKRNSGPAGMEKVHGLAAATRSSDIHPERQLYHSDRDGVRGSVAPP